MHLSSLLMCLMSLWFLSRSLRSNILSQSLQLNFSSLKWQSLMCCFILSTLTNLPHTSQGPFSISELLSSWFSPGMLLEVDLGFFGVLTIPLSRFCLRVTQALCTLAWVSTLAWDTNLGHRWGGEGGRTEGWAGLKRWKRTSKKENRKEVEEKET